MSSKNSKAAAILRASLARRTDPSSSTGTSSIGGTGSTGRTTGLGLPPSGMSHRRNTTHDTIDVNYTLDGDVVEAGVGGGNIEDPTPLTDSIHGPDGITSSSSTSAGSASGQQVHDGHGDIEASLHYSSRTVPNQRRSSAASRAVARSLPRRLSSAKNLVKQLSGLDLRDVALSDHGAGETTTGGGSPTSAAHFPPNGGGGASTSGKDPYAPKDLNTSDSSIEPAIRHDSLFIRFLHSRWMQLGVAAAAIVLIGAVVGVTQSNKNTAAASAGENTNGGVQDGNHGYYPEPTRPSDWPSAEEEEQESQYGVEEPSSTTGTTTITTSSPADDMSTTSTSTGAGNQPSSPSSPTTPSTSTATTAATWLQGPHFTDPAQSTLGSTLSFSQSGTRLAISSKHSSTIQIVKENADGTWSELGQSLPGTVAALSGDGTRIAVADSAESTVTTYELARTGAGNDGSTTTSSSSQQWQIYGTRLIDLWGARDVALSYDGTTLAISHHPDSVCRVCPSVATVYELRPDGEAWLQEYDVLGAYDFDFSVDLSSDGATLLFSGRVYEKSNVPTVAGGGGGMMWYIKNSFPDFISSHSALNTRGTTAAVSLPDCHIFKSTDPTLTDCTNTESHEVSVMEYVVGNAADSTGGSGGYWNRKGISIGPEVNGPAGTTAISLSDDGNTVAVAVGGRGMGGEAAVGGVGGDTDEALNGVGPGGSGALDDPMPLDDNGPLLRRRIQERNGDDSNEDFLYDAYSVPNAYVRVYRYDDSTGDWNTVGEDLELDTSGATVTLTADGRRLALGVPYGGEDERGYVKVYNLVMP